MSIQSEAERIKANVAATYAAAAELGAEMPDAQNSDNLAETVAGIPAGAGNAAEVYTGTKTANGEEVYSITFESEAIIGDNDLFIAYRNDSYYEDAGAVGSEVYSGDINVNMCYYAGVADASAVSASANYYDDVITVSMGGWYDPGITVSITDKAITFDGYRLKNGSWKWIHVKM